MYARGARFEYRTEIRIRPGFSETDKTNGDGGVKGYQKENNTTA